MGRKNKGKGKGKGRGSKNQRQNAFKIAKIRLRKAKENNKPKGRIQNLRQKVKAARMPAARSVKNVAPRKQAVTRAGAFVQTKPSGKTVTIAPTAAVNKQGKLKGNVTYNPGRNINAADVARIQTSGLSEKAAGKVISNTKAAMDFGKTFNKKDINQLKTAGFSAANIAQIVKQNPKAAQSKAGRRAIALSEGQFKGTNYDHGDVFNQQDVKNLKRAGWDRQQIAQYVDSQGIRNKVAARFQLKSDTLTPTTNLTPDPTPTPGPAPGPAPAPTPPGGDGEPGSEVDNSALDDFISGEYQTTLDELQGLQTANAELKEQLAKYENIEAPNTEKGSMSWNWNPNPSLYRTDDPKTPAPKTPAPSTMQPQVDTAGPMEEQSFEIPKVNAPVSQQLNYQPIGTNDNTGSQIFIADDFKTSGSPKIQPVNAFTGNPYQLDVDGLPRYNTMTYAPGSTIPGQLTPKGVAAGGFDPSPPKPSDLAQTFEPGTPIPGQLTSTGETTGGYTPSVPPVPTLANNPYIAQYADGGIGYLPGQAGSKVKNQKYGFGTYPYNFIN